MHNENRKRKVGIVTQPDVQGLTSPRTPSPKRQRENGVQTRSTWSVDDAEEVPVGECRFSSRNTATHLLQLKFGISSLLGRVSVIKTDTLLKHFMETTIKATNSCHNLNAKGR